jgi:hypothetical protein
MYKKRGQRGDMAGESPVKRMYNLFLCADSNGVTDVSGFQHSIS